LLSEARVIALDATFLAGKRSGSGRHDIFEISTVDDDGGTTVCGVFYVRTSKSPYIIAVLECLMEHLSKRGTPLQLSCIFVDECHAGRSCF
jgi:hypothetical protein